MHRTHRTPRRPRRLRHLQRLRRILPALGAAALVVPAAAQTPPETQRVEITGSAVRRIDAETALPVQIVRRDEIARSGATNTAELLQRLPAIQGSFNESSSVGGGAGGIATVSVHNIGDTRTLVLLNGHRLTLFGGQSLTGFGAAVDLNAIPISAIDRIEILTDGASAFYGADAIAGVVNFITRRDTNDGDVTIGASVPRGGARERRISASKGFGRLADDGFSVLLSAAHDERTKLAAIDRNFGKTGKVFFEHEGQSYRKQQFSVSPIPANAVDDLGQLVSPYRLTNGECPAKTFRVIEPYNDGSGLVDDYCGFDFVGELEIFPERKRDTFFGSANVRAGVFDLSADVLYAKTRQVSRIAPVPGNVAIPANTPLHDQYLRPVGITGDTLATYRIFDLGKRESDDRAEFFDVALGAKATLASWDLTAGLNHSRSDSKTNIAGYPGARAITRLRASGLLNPFIGPGEQSAAAVAALAAANYRGYWDGGLAELTSAFVRGSRELFQLPGGAAQLGAGVNYQIEKFQSKPSLFAQGRLADPVAGTPCDPAAGIACDQRFGDEAATVAYSADRKAWGVFAELVMPVAKSLELTGALRHDNYSDFGGATTAKASLRWTPVRSVLVRASVGTGFHAPTVPQVNASVQPFGVTTDNYTCSAALQTVAAAQNASCQPGNRQYDQLAGGNPDLKPEKSRQATLGIQFEPIPQLTLGADLWHVAIRDSFGQLTEEVVFGDPLRYASSWGSKVDTSTGINYLAFRAVNQNLGKSYSTGLDLDVAARLRTGVGDVTSRLRATYMIREVGQLLPDGPYYTAIGNFADLGGVTFRWLGAWTNTLKAGAWTHTATVNFRSGYLDQETDAERLDAAGNVVAVDAIRVKVKEYVTLDWQTSVVPLRNLTLTVGALNLFDTKPPLAISTGGLNRGQQFGYDDRYYDSRGRTWYLNASYRF